MFPFHAVVRTHSSRASCGKPQLLFWEPVPITGRREHIMTRKELREVRESYRSLAQECLKSDTPCAIITGVCRSLANEPRYNHHERGQRLWAFFQALDDEEG